MEDKTVKFLIGLGCLLAIIGSAFLIHSTPKTPPKFKDTIVGIEPSDTSNAFTLTISNATARDITVRFPQAGLVTNEVKVVVVITNGVGNQIALEIPMSIWTSHDKLVISNKFKLWQAERAGH